MARALTAWTNHIALCTDGPSGLDEQEKQQLLLNGVTLSEAKFTRLVGVEARLHHIEFESGEQLNCEVMFFDTESDAQSSLNESLGCTLNERGGIVCDRYEATNVPGVYVAGNIIRDVQLSIVAAAEGARAAFGINLALTREEFAHRSAAN